MLCEICKKNEATVHLKEFRDNGVRFLHICMECAAKKEKESGLHALGFNLAEVLFNIEQSIEKAVENQSAKAKTSPPSITCETCGWTSEKLQHTGGRLGCSDCYTAFAALIRDALDRVQYGSAHLGKRPGCTGKPNTLALKFELEKYQQELAELVKREEYEAAALCRDKIQQLRTELASDKNPPEAPHE